MTFISENEWESFPQSLDNLLDGMSLSQGIHNKAFYTNESVSYSFTINKVTLSLQGGAKGYLRNMISTMTGLPMDIPINSKNQVSSNYFSIHASPQIEYWIKRVNLKIASPIGFVKFGFGDMMASRAELYISPDLEFNWKPDNHWAVQLNGDFGKSPMNLNMIQPGYVMTSCRTFSKGTEDFYNVKTYGISSQISYRNTIHGLFASAYASHNWGKIPYSLSQNLFGDFVAYSYIPADDTSKDLSLIHI